MSSIYKSANVSAPVLTARGVQFAYPGSTGRGFQLSVDHLDVYPGEILALCGASGSGKSTLLAVLAGLLAPISGEIQLSLAAGPQDLYSCGGREWRRRRRELGFVSQNPRESLNDRRTVLDIVTDPLRIHDLPEIEGESDRFFDRMASFCRVAGPTLRRARRELVLESLRKVGIDLDHALRTPQSLSGGQRQRVAIARALVARPRLVFLDEPTSALDVSVQASIANLLLALHQREAQSYVLVTHDLALARQLADRIAIVDQGQIVEVGTTEDILESPTSAVAQTFLEVVQSELAGL